jgi:hypothetical protein
MQLRKSVASLIPTAPCLRTTQHSFPPVFPLLYSARRRGVLPLERAGGAKASPRSGLTFLRNTGELLRWRNVKTLVANLESQFSGRMRRADRAGSELLRWRNVKTLVANLESQFSGRMRRADRAGSKLCAEVPHHTQDRRISSACLRSTWQGEGFARPRCIPSQCRSAAAETLPVSTPSRLWCAVALRLIEVRR